MDDPDISDPGGQSDLALFTAACDGSDAARDELQRRYLHALRTVAAGYRGGDPDRDGLINRLFDDLNQAPVPTAEGAVPITLFTLVREEKLDAAEKRGPIGLVDLAGPRPPDAVVGDAARRQALLDAFADLDQRDQVLLWFSAVEGVLPRSLSSRLSIGGADAASAKAFQARSNLRRSYAERRATSAGRGPACAALAEDLVRWADGDLAPKLDDGARGAHLAGCDHCRRVLAELHQITGGLLFEAAAIRRAMVGTPTATTVPVTAAVAPVAALGAPLPAPHDDGAVESLDDLDAAGDTEIGSGRPRAAAVLLVAALLAAALGGVAFWRERVRSHDTQVQAGNPGGSPAQQSPATSTRATVSIAPVRTASTATSTSSTTTTTTTTTRNGGSHSNAVSSGGTSGTWTDPGTTGTTAAATSPPATVASTTAPPATTAPATTSATTATTEPETTSATTVTP